MALKLSTVKGKETSKRGEFTDFYGSQCSIQDSSGAEPAIWLGVEVSFKGKRATRMHLTQEQAKALLPHLQRFAKQGRL